MYKLSMKEKKKKKFEIIKINYLVVNFSTFVVIYFYCVIEMFTLAVT